jgi:ElaB/YqjD/DUF883 family membrane-anchored ribosome-binding protein
MIAFYSRERDHRMKRSQNLNKLVDDVEELLATLREDQQPEIKELCGRIEDAIESTKDARTAQHDARAARRARATARIGRYAASVDNYITGYPRLGFITGVLVGGAVVHMARRLTPQH